MKTLPNSNPNPCLCLIYSIQNNFVVDIFPDNRKNESDLAELNGPSILKPTALRRKKRQDNKADTTNAAGTL